MIFLIYHIFTMKDDSKNKGKNLNQKDPSAFKFDENAKKRQMEEYNEDPKGQYMTTDQGVRVTDVDNSLTAGERGPTLMEDFHFRERMTSFDHESIPERVVHARGSGATDTSSLTNHGRNTQKQASCRIRI